MGGRGLFYRKASRQNRENSSFLNDTIIISWENCFTGHSTRFKGCSERELSWQSFNSMNTVQVLDKSDLVTSSRTLPGDNGRIGQKIFPNLINIRYTELEEISFAEVNLLCTTCSHILLQPFHGY
jgi:hypothetical protein